MNNRILLNGGVFILVGLISACSSRDQVNENSAKTYAYAIREDQNGLLDIHVYDMLRKREVDVVPTRASAVHRYEGRWISESCILFESSDIGSRVVDVVDKCQIYFAKKERNGIGLKVVLYDEMWSPIGRELKVE